jgi:predicted GIY-YIG superfamily endonuclease
MRNKNRSRAIASIRRKRLAKNEKRPVVVNDGPPVPGLSQHHCYALSRGRRTYVGYTVEPARRIRQHNGEIKGGARATTSGTGSWDFLFVVAAEDLRFGSHEGLSLEWHLKRRPKGTSKSLSPIQSRIEMLRGALGLAKFAWLLPKVVVFVRDSHLDAVFAALLDLPQAVCVLPLSEFI